MGELLCASAGLAWLGFGLIGVAELGPHIVLVAVVAAGGLLLATLALHQISDPSFGGSYLRSAERRDSDSSPRL